MPEVVSKYIVRGFEHRKRGGQVSGGSESWTERIEAPGWKLYDYAIHEISRRNAEANVTVDDTGITIEGRTHWDPGFGAGGNYKAEVTAWFWTVFEPYVPSSIRSVAAFLSTDGDGYSNAQDRILNNIRSQPSPQRIGLQVANGQFVCAEGGGGGAVVANRDRLLGWETFTLVRLGGDDIALQAANGQFVCAEAGGGREVVANRDRILGWETFDMIDKGNGKIALEAANGQFLCAEEGGGREIVANRDQALGWETFVLIRL